MFITRVEIKNWRNFKRAEVELGTRAFVVGPNASGKSNFLDVFKFLRDTAKSGGGLQQAIIDRGGLSRIRCLAAREDPEVSIAIELADEPGERPRWKYALGIKQPTGRPPRVSFETVHRDGVELLNRPDSDDRQDTLRLRYTHLEQINSNANFRVIAEFFQAISYMHLVPQLVRHPREFSGPGVAGDPFGRSFLERMALVPEKTRKARLRVVERALRVAVPQLKNLAHVIDAKEGGVPHLEAIYEHWRPQGAKQRERDFSDGTLRLLALLWVLLDGDSLLLLEEPELSLHSGIVTRLADLIHRLQQKMHRQVFISTHSYDLLSDRGIGAEETILLTPAREGTRVEQAASINEIRAMLDSGLSIADVALPRTAPVNADQLDMFE